MGMETQEVGIKANLTIRLKSANEKLDEVMVVAYGTAKKSSFTGAAEVIKNEQLEKMNVVSVTKALEGTSPGLQVMGGTGQPGSGATVRIRGIGSSFSADRIRPETFFVCALSMHTPIQRNASNRYNRFLIKIGLGLKIVNNKYKCLSIFRMHLRRAVKPGEARSVLSYALHEHILHLI